MGQERTKPDQDYVGHGQGFGQDGRSFRRNGKVRRRFKGETKETKVVWTQKEEKTMNELIQQALEYLAEALEQDGENSEVAEDVAWNIIFTRSAHLHQLQWLDEDEK